MKKLLLFAVLAMTCWVSTVHAEMTPEKRAEIEKMLRLTGMQKLVDQMMTQMTTSLAGSMPDVPPEFWAKFKEKMNSRDLIEKIMPVYDKYYTVEDLKAINAFYETPTGQKILSNMPQVMKECMQIGQDWGRKVGEEAAREARQDTENKK